MFRPTYLQLFRKDEEELGVETICVSTLIYFHKLIAYIPRMP